MLKLSSAGKVHGYQTIHPEMSRGHWIFFIRKFCFSDDANMLFPESCLFLFFLRYVCLLQRLEWHITHNLFSWPLWCLCITCIYDNATHSSSAGNRVFMKNRIDTYYLNKRTFLGKRTDRRLSLGMSVSAALWIVLCPVFVCVYF